MWLEVRNIQTKVARATDEEVAWLSSYLSFEDARARFRGGGDQRFRLFNGISMTFPSGLLPLVQRGAVKEGFTIELADRRVVPLQADMAADLAWLRDYQLEAVDTIVAKARGILHIVTGGGKTECFAALTRRLPGKWLFLVHRTTLVDQAADRVELRTGASVGRVGEGRWCSFSDEQRIICASFQTLHARLVEPEAQALLAQADGVCVDECHTIPAETFYRIVMMTRGAYWRVGLSGTPLARGDKRSVLAISALGPVVYRIKPERLITAGVLTRPRIRLVPVAQQSDKPTWQGVYGECIVRSKARNRALVEAARRAPKPCLVFVKEIAHGRLLDKAIRSGGLRSEFVWGSDSSTARRGAVKRLVRSDIDVLVCSVVFQEGVDIPELQSVIVGSGGRSAIAALQRIGRGMRVAEGKTEFVVYDIKDVGNKWLERHTRERIRAYTSEGHETIIESTV